MQGKQLDPIPLLLPLNLLLLVPFGHLLEKVKTKVLERWCALPLSLLYSFSAAAVTASWQLHTVNRFMKAMCIQALPSTLLSCQEQNNLGNVYSSRSIHIVYVYSSPCVHIHHVYLSSTIKKRAVNENVCWRKKNMVARLRRPPVWKVRPYVVSTDLLASTFKQEKPWQLRRLSL